MYSAEPQYKSAVALFSTSCHAGREEKPTEKYHLNFKTSNMCKPKLLILKSIRMETELINVNILPETLQTFIQNCSFLLYLTRDTRRRFKHSYKTAVFSCTLHNTRRIFEPEFINVLRRSEPYYNAEPWNQLTPNLKIIFLC